MATVIQTQLEPEPETIGWSGDEFFEDEQVVEVIPSDPRVKELAGLFTGMNDCKPGILRATPACAVLAFGALPLRWVSQDLYHHSVPVNLIKDFWSHSWHGSKYLKMLLLLLLYNGPAAVVAATLSAVVMMGLQLAEFLPGVAREARSSLDAGLVSVFGPWCTLAAGCIFTLFLFTWKSQRMIFFDQICIHQTNQELKFEGIVSLGAILRRSKNFLLVWDATYASRLWCMLELAAFVTSHENPEDKIHIWPTAMAPCLLCLAAGIWLSMLQFTLFHSTRIVVDVMILFGVRWLCACVGSTYLRAHYRNTEVMLAQLSNFRVSSAKCHCCSKGHERADGTRIICDRDVISRCIQTWYGSVETFEVMVRTRIRIMLYRQLGGLLFPYRWLLLGSAPILWGFMDLATARGRVGNWITAGYFVWAMLGWWLFLFPFSFQITLLMANYFRRQESHPWLDRLKTGVVAFVLTAVSLLGNIASNAVHDLLTAVLWTAGSALLFGATWMALRCQARKVELQLDVIKADSYMDVMTGASNTSSATDAVTV